MFKGLLDWIRRVEAAPGSSSGEESVLIDAGPRHRVIDTNLRARLQPLHELGRGGMSSVHAARDLQLLRSAALKVMHPQAAASSVNHQQFIVEARITAQLDHPSVVPVYEFGQDADGVPYITMRQIGGQTLESLIHADPGERLAPDNLRQVVRVLLRVCEALGYAHSRGVVHRDVKPSNVMIGDFGEVYIMDWGVALADPALAQGEAVRITAPHEPGVEQAATVGTPAYMAPELTVDDLRQQGPWTDIFGVGATLYHVLAGQPPYGNQGQLSAVMAAAARGDRAPLLERPANGGAPPALVRIAQRAMAIEPTRRHPDMAALGEELQAFLEGRGPSIEIHHPPGALIVAEGDVGDCGYIIRSGQCRVFCVDGGAKRILRELGPGDVYGEVAVFSGGPRSSSVEAVTAVTLELLTRETLLGGAPRDAALLRFVTALAERFVDVDRRERRQALHPPVSGHAQRLRDWLAEHRVQAEFLTFARSVHSVREAVEVSGHPVERFTKSIVMVDEQGRAIVAVVPAESRASTERVRKALGLAQRPRVASAEECMELLDQQVGGNAPLNAGQATVLVDPLVLEKDWILTGGGDDRSLVRITTAELRRVVEPRVVRVRK